MMVTIVRMTSISIIAVTIIHMMATNMILTIVRILVVLQYSSPFFRYQFDFIRSHYTLLN